MDVILNGKPLTVAGGPDGVTVRELLERLELTAGPVAVEVNREIVPRAEHAVRRVAPGDVIEVVHLVGGG
jgi:sulfur carrier protein